VTPLTLLVAVGLTAIAAVAVLWPYHRGSAAALQRLADPLEDERRRALRHLRDLDEDRGAGKLDEAGYRDARAEAEARAVAVLRALEAREGTGELAGSLREVRRPAPSGATRRPGGRLPGRRWPRRAVAALVGVVVVVGAAALLDGAVGDRGTGQLITGQAATGDAAPGSPGAASLEGLERRVREHPGDVGAHLTLAERYLDAGRLKEATVAYLGALKLDPSNVEANTQLGLLLFRSGLPEPGLRSVEQALAADPRYPEALYAKGLILFMGLRQPKAAVPSLRSYLHVAPFGEHRDLAEQLLELATATPGARPPGRSSNSTATADRPGP
jgi:cytochrome c-type biogenesis protein CcmI